MALTLAQGSVVALDPANGEPAELEVQGVRGGLAELVVAGARLGVRIKAFAVDGKS